jgi:hypothetical protein
MLAGAADAPRIAASPPAANDLNFTPEPQAPAAPQRAEVPPRQEATVEALERRIQQLELRLEKLEAALRKE